MKKLKKAAAFLMSLALILGVGSVRVAAVEGTVVQQLTVEYKQSMARAVLDHVNDLRTQESWQYDANGNRVTVQPMNALAYDYTLEQIAMQRAAELAVLYSHTRPNGENCFTAFTGSWRACGENIAYGYNMLETAEEVYTAWLEENEDYAGQGHRRNMQNQNFTAIGMGCVYYNGYIFWAMELGTPYDAINDSDPGAADETRTVAIEVIDNGDEGGNTPGEDEGGNTPGEDEGGNTPGGDEGGNTPGGDEGGNTPGEDEGGNTPGGDEGGNTPGEDEGGNTPGGDEGGNTPGGDEGGNTPGEDEGGNTPGGDEGGNTSGGDEGGNTPGGDEGGNTPGEDEGGDSSADNGNADSADDDSNEDVVVNVDWSAVNSDLGRALQDSVAQNITFAVGGSTEIPTDILNRLAGSKATLALQAGNGLTVTISGTDVKKVDSSLTVSISGNVNIPNSVKQQVVSGNTASREFTMGDKGAYSYPIAVHVNLGRENAGRQAVLYCYDELAGTMKSVGSFTITESGQAMFGVKCGGQYIAVAGGQFVQSGQSYTVVSGDTLYGIARKNGVSYKALRDANSQINNINIIYPGQKINIP